MPYYPPSFPSKEKGSSNELLRVLGVFLSLSGMILAAVSIFFHQSIPGLVISVVVGLFGLRVFMLWLRARARSVSPASRLMIPTHSSHGYSFFSTAPKSASGGRKLYLPARSVSPEIPPEAAPIESAFIKPGFERAPIGPNISLSPRAGASPAPVIQSLRRSPASSLSHAPITAYPSQPAYVAQTTLVQAQQPPIIGERRPQAPASLAPYIPPIFELDPPAGNVECFILPKEGAPLVECQDRYALHAKYRCYAVADGVAGSFVPGPWARIIAKGFVERNGTFLNKEDFQDWLVKCSQQWHSWLDSRWLPTMQAISKYSGDSSGDRSKEIRPGAQTTLIGCSLLSQREQQGAASAVSVFAIGDCQFFLFRRNTGWSLVETFPYSNPDEFGSRPVTLVTTLRADLIERAWAERKTKLCKVYPGDIIVLASDTLAKWLLMQVHHHTDRWKPLLSGMTPAEFEQHIRTELHNDHIEDDDLTMLIIPIQ